MMTIIITQTLIVAVLLICLKGLERKLNKKLEGELDNVFHVLKKYKDRLDVYEQGLCDGLQVISDLQSKPAKEVIKRKATKKKAAKKKVTKKKATKKKVAKKQK